MNAGKLLRAGILLIFLTASCSDNILNTEAVVNAATDKLVYSSEQLIIVVVNNFSNREVYINQCGESLYPTIIRIDSSSSGGTIFTPVCRQLTNYELSSGKSVSDTLGVLLPGRYKLKYLYDFENIMPELCREELYSNEFDIQ